MKASSTKATWQRPLVTTLDLPKPEGAYFDQDAADRVIGFFGMLPHVKGRWAGEPFTLEDWQREEIVAPLFGWRRADGTRLYRECYIRIARKNGKSTLAAGIAGYLLYADREKGPEVYSAAVDREQAGIVFGALSEMVQSSPELAARSKVLRRAIAVPKTNGSYKVLSADAPNKHGLNASGVIVDELHAHPSRDLFDVLSTSTGAREQPLVFSITTAGVWQQDGICVEKDDYTRQVAAGIVADPAFLGVIYALEDDDDWADEDVWPKANPGIGTTISAEYLRRERDKAMASVAAQNTFRMLHGNQWVQQATRWIDLGVWDSQAGEVDEDELLGKVCYGGLDIGAVSDLTAWVLVFPGEDDQVQVLARFFAPEGALETGKQNSVIYQQFRQAGLLEVTPGNATDYGYVRTRIVTDAAKFDLRGMNADFLFQGGQLVSELLEEGLPVLSMRQTHMAYGLPMKELERRLAERRVHHGGNAVLRWMADNIVVRSDFNGNLKPDKEKSKQKIDGMVALAMAFEFLTVEQYVGDPQVQVF